MLPSPNAPKRLPARLAGPIDPILPTVAQVRRTTGPPRAWSVRRTCSRTAQHATWSAGDTVRDRDHRGDDHDRHTTRRSPGNAARGRRRVPRHPLRHRRAVRRARAHRRLDRHARRHRPRDAQCPQTDRHSSSRRSARPTLPMSEDCLCLDIVTPACDDARRPVMVWIHGGGFTSGSGSMPWYDGESLARRGDIVVVTINYRLGVARLRRHLQLRHPRPDRRARMGARPHRHVRRRPRPGDDRRRVGRRLVGRRPAGHACGSRAVRTPAGR